VYRSAASCSINSPSAARRRPRRIAAYGHEGALRRLHPDLPIFPDEIVLIYRADLPKNRAAALF